MECIYNESGQVVAVSKNLAVINNYRRRAKTEAHTVVVDDRKLFIKFRDGATFNTVFGDASVLRDFVRSSMIGRHARKMRIDGHDINTGWE
jgi:hypothetical protein